MEAEEEYRDASYGKTLAKLGENRSGEEEEEEGSDDEDDDASHEVSAFDAVENLDGGVRLASRVVKSTSKSRPFDSSWVCTALARSAARDDSQHSKEAAVAARDAILESKACAKFASAVPVRRRRRPRRGGRP